MHNVRVYPSKLVSLARNYEKVCSTSLIFHMRDEFYASVDAPDELPEELSHVEKT